MVARKSPATKSAAPRRAPRKTAKKAAGESMRRTTPGGAAMHDQMARLANVMTPDQAIELYKANAKMALDVINAAIDSTARLRKLQFEGEESAREFGRRAARGAAEAKDAQSLMVFSQEHGREAIEKSLVYWQEMFGLIAEMQKRLFTLMEEQAQGMPGYKQAKAAMQLMPDLGPMKNVVDAMQGLVGSGGNAFSSMQKVLNDMTAMAQSALPGSRR